MVRAFVCGVCLAAALTAEPRGFQPRASRTQYTVTSFTHTFAMAATMVPRDEVVRLFGAEADRRYIVVEMGFFSKNGAAFDLRYSDFALKLYPSKNLIAAASPAEVSRRAGVDAERQMLPEGAATRRGGYLFFPAKLGPGEGCEVEYTGLQSWLTMPVRAWR